MSILDPQIGALLSMDILRHIAAGESCSLAKLNTLTTILMANQIPFDTSFSPGSRRESPSVELTIYLTPSSTMVFTINSEKAPGVFNNN